MGLPQVCQLTNDQFDIRNFADLVDYVIHPKSAKDSIENLASLQERTHT